MSIETNLRQALTEHMCEGTIWTVDQIANASADDDLVLVLRVSKRHLAAESGRGPSSLLDKLIIPAFKREARISELERQLEIERAKLEGVLLANGVVTVGAKRP